MYNTGAAKADRETDRIQQCTKNVGWKIHTARKPTIHSCHKTSGKPKGSLLSWDFAKAALIGRECLRGTCPYVHAYESMNALSMPSEQALLVHKRCCDRWSGGGWEERDAIYS